MVKKAEVKTFIKRLYCDDCGELMVKLDMVLTSYPVQFQYHCNNCNAVVNSTISYPEQVLEIIEGTEREDYYFEDEL